MIIRHNHYQPGVTFALRVEYLFLRRLGLVVDDVSVERFTDEDSGEVYEATRGQFRDLEKQLVESLPTDPDFWETIELAGAYA